MPELHLFGLTTDDDSAELEFAIKLSDGYSLDHFFFPADACFVDALSYALDELFYDYSQDDDTLVID